MRRATSFGSLTRMSAWAGRRCLSLSAAALALLGCGGGSDGGNDPAGPGATVQSVTVTPGTQVLAGAGASGQLTATVVRSDGPVASPTVAWVSANPSVATVAGTGATATVTALSAGGATITATSGGVSGSATVTVSQSSQALTVTLSGAGVGTVVSTPAGINCPTTCTGAFAFEASVGLTATAAAGSSFTGWSGACTGTTTCTVTMTQARSVTATFAAAPAAVASVVVTAPLTNLDEGAAGQLTATVRDAAGNALTGRVVTWVSSDQATATVSATGQVAGIAEGDTVIVTATSEGKNGTAKVVVRSLYFIAREVAVGQSHTCAVRLIGGTYCWGARAFGQLGNPLNPGDGQRIITAGPNVFTHVATGTTHTCGLTSAGAAYCFGLNNSRELGVGSIVPYETLPLPVSGGLVFARLFGRDGTTCALTSNGTAYCWGQNGVDQLALGTLESPVTAPRAVVGGHRFRTLAMGSGHTCGIDTDGALWCWGNNSPGQLGIGSPPVQVAVPTLVKSGTRFTAVAGGTDHTCGIDSDGLVWCWGANHQGQIGEGTTQQRTTPVRIASNLTFTQITAGDRFTCAIASSGDVWCWGLNNGSQLGTGTTGNSLVPAKASAAIGFTSIATNYSAVCAIAVNRRVYCWGNNSTGQAGSAPSLPIITPTLVLRP
jgi:alpha-tubulin suppressor-like RCC1 family protein